jgi:hypothetical protein
MSERHAGPIGSYQGKRQGSSYAALQHHAVLPCSTTPCNMIPTILALVPLVFATGCLVWTMTSGAQAQARSDAWAAKWMSDNA